MNIVKTKVMAALLGATVLAASPVVAQDKSGTNKAEEPLPATEGSKAVEKTALGLRLAEYARENDDAQAMLIAARIMQSVGLRDSDEKGELEGSSEVGEVENVSAETLLDEAEQLAGDDDTLLEAIAETRAAGSKGAVGGPIRVARYVPGATTWNVDFNARGGEPLLIAASRDSATPVDLKVFDENGYLVCQDMSHNVVLQCRVDPAWSGPFRVQMINHGGSGTGLVMVSN